MTKTVRLFRLVFAIVFALLLWVGPARARLVQPRDAIGSVLSAERVVIVSHESGDIYRVERAFLGTTKYGDKITVPGFSLYTDQQYGPAKVEPITADTRILMFLYFSHGYIDKPDCWQTTHYNYGFFWEQDPSRTENLVNIALTSLALRKSWEAARDRPDAHERVAALWPFLDVQTYGVDIQRHTEQELQKTKPTAGDYIASKFDAMDQRLQMSLLPEFGQYGGDKLHRKLIQFLQERQAHYDVWLTKHGTAAKDKRVGWEQLPPDIQGLSNDLNYGLGGLGSFHDRTDLPFIRRFALWMTSHRVLGVCGSVLDNFRLIRDSANLPIIAAVWKTYSWYPAPDQTLNPMDAIYAFSAGSYVAAIPYLTPFLDNEDTQVVALGHAALVRAVGTDLGRTPRVWLAWYAQHRPAHH